MLTVFTLMLVAQVVGLSGDTFVVKIEELAFVSQSHIHVICTDNKSYLLGTVNHFHEVQFVYPAGNL